MIRRSNHFNLGQDTTRIKDPNDARRQEKTTDAILHRFFNPSAKQRFEIQVLADEVGMGKTFVALATAYSILAAMREGSQEADLQGCYQKILVLTPPNSALFNKWNREVEEFVRRCVLPRYRKDADWFAPMRIERIDDLVAAVRKSGKRQVLIASMGILSGGKLLNYDLKRRFTLGVLFRYWKNRFNVEARERLLRGAPDGWPKDPYSLTQLEEWEEDLLPFKEDELLAAVADFDKEYENIDDLLEICKEVSQPWTRDRAGKFGIRGIDGRLTRIFRWAICRLIRQAFPLLIVDEAHNWKNGPSYGSNGFRTFADDIAPHVRRALLLTATPFQLRPEEMLEVLKVSDHIMPCTTQRESEERREKLRQYREDVIRPVLQNSERASKRFSKAWTRLPQRLKTDDLMQVWMSPSLSSARQHLQQLAEDEGAVNEQDGRFQQVVNGGLAGIDPDLRQLMREALRLYAYNSDLSVEMGKLVIRHRRETGHRLFRVGMEYALPQERVAARPDGHLLHQAPGLDVRGDGELPHYLLMRCVSEMKGGRGRSSLGSALTGCYSTLLHSAEGRNIQKRLKDSSDGHKYLNLLMGMVTEDQDEDHPKVRQVVDAVLQRWQDGEKVLLFCFRVNTAERLRVIIDKRIRSELDRRREACLGGGEALRNLRARFTGRERDLVGLGLDRLLWSLLWLTRTTGETDGLPDPEQFLLDDNDLLELAHLSRAFNIDLRGDRIDRVFLNRATECVLARRFLRQSMPSGLFGRVLKEMAKPSWISHPYGLETEASVEDADDTPSAGVQTEERTSFDERGVHHAYDIEEDRDDTNESDKKVARDLAATRDRARKQGQVALLDAYAQAPSLWIGSRPIDQWRSVTNQLSKTIQALHDHLWQLSEQHGSYDWTSRLLVFQSLRRAILRESVLLRLLPDRSEREESGWGELIVDAFYREMHDQRESMADRIAVFVEDLRASSGTLSNPEDRNSARYALFDATRLRDQQFVAIAKGGGGGKFLKARERIFNGFNTPLLPEILICTTVGQEGIDLHRHCRHVIHYDLAWNPATLEQRTGRVDRIGSKTFRERSLTSERAKPFLEVGVPFLAGTYDERMYEELRLRAQTFEVLTGGDFAAENAEGRDDVADAEGSECNLSVVPLPPQMLNHLRVDLQVWKPESPHPADQSRED